MKVVLLRKSIGIPFLLFLSNISFAQSAVQRKYLSVGDTIPDYTFSKMNDYPHHSAKIIDFRGRWLILDLWNKGCFSCIQSFPKIDGLRKEFEGRVQIILVGLQDKEKEIETLYGRHRSYHNLKITNTFDSTFFRTWDIHAGPYIIVINPKGIVEAITTKIDSNQLNDLIAGKQVQFTKAMTTAQIAYYLYESYDRKKPYLIDGNGGADTSFMYRSVFGKWNPNIRVVTDLIETEHNPGGRGTFQAIGVDLKTLYKLAYFGSARWPRPEDKVGSEVLYGNYWPEVQLKMRDTSEFVFDRYEGKGLYCYNLTIPPKLATIESIKKNIQNDLHNLFRYQVKVVEEEFPVWELSVTSQSYRPKILTTTDKNRNVLKREELYINNGGIQLLLNYLIIFHGKQGVFTLDPTFKDYNISLNLKGLLTDYKVLLPMLEKSGFVIKQKYKKMKVLQIWEKEF